MRFCNSKVLFRKCPYVFPQATISPWSLPLPSLFSFFLESTTRILLRSVPSACFVCWDLWSCVATRSNVFIFIAWKTSGCSLLELKLYCLPEMRFCNSKVLFRKQVRCFFSSNDFSWCKCTGQGTADDLLLGRTL